MKTLLVKLPPLEVTYDGNLVFNLMDVRDPVTDQVAEEIESAHKIYRLKTWNSNTLEYVYTLKKETAPMTTPTPTTPDRMTAAELRAAFADLHSLIESQQSQILNLAESLDRIQEGLSHAAQPATASSPNTNNGPELPAFLMDTILMGYDDAGKPTYKGKGGKFTKFGVRIWPEVLPALGIDPAKLQPGPNAIRPPLAVMFELTTEGNPRKVTGPFYQA